VICCVELTDVILFLTSFKLAILLLEYSVAVAVAVYITARATATHN